MNQANDVRRSLQAVVDFGLACRCAVIGITHFKKGSVGHSPQERVIGSQAFGALARMVLVAAKEAGGDQRVLARAKSNIAADDGGFSYILDVVDVGDGVQATRVVWDGQISGTAREILSEVEDDERGDSGKEAHASRFLSDLLSGGPLPSIEVRAACETAGLSWITVRRAKKLAGVVAYKDGMKGGWNWRLSVPSPEDDHPTAKTLIENE
jgi:putative DNA primase/helicase